MRLEEGRLSTVGRASFEKAFSSDSKAISAIAKSKTVTMSGHYKAFKGTQGALECHGRGGRQNSTTVTTSCTPLVRSCLRLPGIRRALPGNDSKY